MSIQVNVNSSPVMAATTLTSETPLKLPHISCKPYNMHVVDRPITTLRRLLSNVKNKDRPEDGHQLVYKIKYFGYQATFIRSRDRQKS